MRILAVDFGLKKIGLAISEGYGVSLMPVMNYSSKEKALQTLVGICFDSLIDEIVFGIPNPDKIGAKKFADLLQKTTKIKITFMDESLTTKLASQRMTKKHKSKEDSISASILLEDHLETKKNNGS